MTSHEYDQETVQVIGATMTLHLENDFKPHIL